ncbi:hypothetical protein [Faecalispora jeddahensis]|uniref:hypothetical protein n=1 Tax=Faecalispora jeddahensis TaxID=1414721 RepID=UPI0028A63113|nr:hypothetical protein [Faecalispora jeddahensis]
MYIKKTSILSRMKGYCREEKRASPASFSEFSHQNILTIYVKARNADQFLSKIEKRD